MRNSERMYKRRIQLWHLDKNNKEHEIRAALQLALQRQKDGLKPVSGVRIRHRNLTWADINRYLRRRRVEDPQKWAVEGLQTDESQESEKCPAGTESMQDPSPLNAATADNQSILAPASFGLDILSCPSPRQEDVVVEKMHRAVHAYCEWEYDVCGSEPVRTWLDVSTPNRRKFSRLLESGIADLRTRKLNRAFRRFDRAFGQIRIMFEKNDRRLLLALFG